MKEEESKKGREPEINIPKFKQQGFGQSESLWVQCQAQALGDSGPCQQVSDDVIIKPPWILHVFFSFYFLLIPLLPCLSALLGLGCECLPSTDRLYMIGAL